MIEYQAVIFYANRAFVASDSTVRGIVKTHGKVIATALTSLVDINGSERLADYSFPNVGLACAGQVNHTITKVPAKRNLMLLARFESQQFVEEFEQDLRRKNYDLFSSRIKLIDMTAQNAA